FMREYGEFVPDNPSKLEELVDSLARRAAATERRLAALTPAQREELAALLTQTLEDAVLSMEMQRLGSSLRQRRPDLDWSGSERMSGEDPMSLGDATTALEELGDLAELEGALRQDYPGARMDDIDEEAVRRALGRQAVDDLAELRRIEAELERQGYLKRRGGSLDLTPKAVRRLGETALRRVFAQLDSSRRGDHDQLDAGQAGELTGSSRPWRSGDEQPIDVIRTLSNALRRGGTTTTSSRPRVRLDVDDFEVLETERRTAAAVCLLVDLSYSMALRGTWGSAKQTALALHTLVASKYPQDAIQIIGFSNYARELQPTELAGLDWDMVQGTNLHHALMISGRHLDKHPEHDPIVLVITDGEPTAHLLRDGRSSFDWPPSRETLELTLAEVDKMTRRRATLNIFMLADDERLVSFVEEVARRNGGRVFAPTPERLGEYVVRDYLRVRRGTR
ncbi:MAG: von Willebrand factor type, partial [Actinoallomurus sp.]|nr:von Willebrand factor type [Actinoallomurus sp.]